MDGESTSEAIKPSFWMRVSAYYYLSREFDRVSHWRSFMVAAQVASKIFCALLMDTSSAIGRGLARVTRVIWFKVSTGAVSGRFRAALDKLRRH